MLLRRHHEPAPAEPDEQTAPAPQPKTVGRAKPTTKKG
ncbi:hypothetical protein SEA_CUMBERBATCH_9 [Streptomyces phage Cumberbatch]|uniref:Uncharacterized protein n=4 Tax=Ignaciovirus TaxID=3152509 RepID=A0A7D5KAI0_9CAUD|nr:hypothetical protein QEN61_gp09 [Streptomyces phage Eklok]YP_010756245.1 hypothetical protein QEN62_gp09 [Streptomyces phage AxeJC]YP_010756419.1 hypothetical protein QEN65_gp09 [Streptomyces phage Cumberbatch]YP_010756478.1 hypothetical protein QEN66_gp09 [Streptomyces phage Piccadilly]YP_010756536.1 hypothetical protein QEN67_gp09 [Streptomyces phage Eastland]QKN87651.1 hypothetical protein SEA_CUMBERBATCH_9 [Streptomyces phage Cumberbatch]QLF83195.1 hypothetical protein SEA_EKLOK_9 [Str